MSGRVLVIGAAGGVGGAVTKLLLSQGYEVIGTVLDQKEAYALRDAAPDVDDVVIMDLADARNVQLALAPLLERTLRLDAVVVCAAISPYGPLETSPLEALRRTIEINAVSALAVYQQCMAALRLSRGRFVLVSSFAGRVALPFVGHYVASKFALEGLADVMRREASKWGVHVALIEPGGIKTSMLTNQTGMLKRDIAALPPATESLYGDLYRQFAALNAGSYEKAQPPEAVAEVILTAMASAKPKARYRVGAQAKMLITLNWLLSSAGMDGVVRKFFKAAASTATGAAPVEIKGAGR